jgi:competence protein ComEC
VRPRSAGRQPLLWVALAFAAGLSTGLYAWRPPIWWLIAAIAFFASGIYFSRQRSWAAYALGLGTVFVIGALSIQAGRTDGSTGASVLEFADGREVSITAHVIAEGIQRGEAPGEASQRIDVETEQIVFNNRSVPAQSGIRVSVFSQEKAAAGELVSSHFFSYGDRVRFSAKLYPPRNFRNPGAFDYQGYLAENSIAALASAKAPDIELMPGFTGNRAELWRTRIRRSIIDAHTHSLAAGQSGIDGGHAPGR